MTATPHSWNGSGGPGHHSSTAQDERQASGVGLPSPCHAVVAVRLRQSNNCPGTVVKVSSAGRLSTHRVKAYGACLCAHALSRLHLRCVALRQHDALQWTSQGGLRSVDVWQAAAAVGLAARACVARRKPLETVVTAALPPCTRLLRLASTADRAASRKAGLQRLPAAQASCGAPP